MDPQAAHRQTMHSSEATFALTRELLARSRATLDAVNKRLAGAATCDGALRHPPSPDSPSSGSATRRHSRKESS